MTLYELDWDALRDDVIEGVREKLYTQDISPKYIDFKEIH